MNVTWNGGSLWGRRSFFQRKSGCSGPLFSQSHTVQNGGKRLLVFGIRRARRHAQKRDQPVRLQHSYQPLGLLGARRGLIAQIRRQSALPIQLDPRGFPGYLQPRIGLGQFSNQRLCGVLQRLLTSVGLHLVHAHDNSVSQPTLLRNPAVRQECDASAVFVLVPILGNLECYPVQLLIDKLARGRWWCRIPRRSWRSLHHRQRQYFSLDGLEFGGVSLCVARYASQLIDLFIDALDAIAGIWVIG